MRRSSIVLFVASAACGTAAERAAPVTHATLDTTASAGTVARPTAARDTGAASARPTGAPAVATAAELPVVRGLYVNRFAAQSRRRMQKLIGMADSTDVNALVIDVKDEFGLNIASNDSLLKRNAGNSGVIPNARELLDTLKAHGILPIARIVVFKDSVAARANPDHVIRKADGSTWRDKQGLAWVNPYDEAIWEYNFRVAEEAVRLGFGEIQFDYIRFPEPYKSLPKQVFPDERGRSKPEALAQFLTAAKRRLDKLGVRTTADVFGLVTTVKGPLEVGQQWEKLSPMVDVVLPMTYPSHYPRGSYGIAHPNAEPYKIQLTAIKAARERDEKLGLRGERVRPWIQAFSLGPPKYDASHVKEQIRGIADAGYQGWVLWNPGSIYEPFLPALGRP